MLALSLDAASMLFFALASGMVMVLHVLEKHAYDVLRSRRAKRLDSEEKRAIILGTKELLGRFHEAGIPQLKAGLLAAGTVCSAGMLLVGGRFTSARGLLVLYGAVFIPIMAMTALPAARGLALVPSSASTDELGESLFRLLKANRIGTLATLSFLVFSVLISPNF